jgi:hypothetical protein
MNLSALFPHRTADQPRVAVRIQFFSDVHLEFGTVHMLPTRADVVVAAGDIGLGTQGIEWLRYLGKPVVYVAGNHEFYGADYATTLAELREAAEGTNVHFLEKDVWEFQGVRFIGCTLWSDLGGHGYHRFDELIKCVNDFRRIRQGAGPLAPADYLHWYESSRRWLLDQIERPYPGRTVVVTHHAPTHQSWHFDPEDIRRYAYCNDFSLFLHTFDVAAWFHGHVHSKCDYRCGDVRILCNPRGYFPKGLVDEFDSGRVIEI